MRFASFLFGWFTTMAVINPPEKKLAKHISVHSDVFKTVFIWDRRFGLTVILTENRINLDWSYSTHCAVLSWVALLTARLLHFINGDRPARWRVPLFARRCPLGCLGSKIFEFDNGHSNVLIFTYFLWVNSSYKSKILVQILSIAVLKRLQNCAFIFIKRVIMFWK